MTLPSNITAQLIEALQVLDRLPEQACSIFISDACNSLTEDVIYDLLSFFLRFINIALERMIDEEVQKLLNARSRHIFLQISNVSILRVFKDVVKDVDKIGNLLDCITLQTHHLFIISFKLFDVLERIKAFLTNKDATAGVKSALLLHAKYNLSAVNNLHDPKEVIFYKFAFANRQFGWIILAQKCLDLIIHPFQYDFVCLLGCFCRVDKEMVLKFSIWLSVFSLLLCLFRWGSCHCLSFARRTIF